MQFPSIKNFIFFCRLLDAEMDQPKRKYVCSQCDKFLTVEFEKTRLDMCMYIQFKAKSTFLIFGMANLTHQ